MKKSSDCILRNIICCPIIKIIFFSLAIAFLIIVIILTFDHLIFPHLIHNGNEKPVICRGQYVHMIPYARFSTELHAIALILLTATIVVVAYIQANRIAITQKTDLLLRIETRYSSKESVKAKEIIHSMYLFSKKKCLEENNKTTHECYEITRLYCMERVGKMIIDISNIKEKSDAKENEFPEIIQKDPHGSFTYLINFLDFLETMAYFSNSKKLIPEELAELFENSLNYYYEIFHPWIKKRRVNLGNPNLYEQLEKFVHANPDS